MMHIAFGIYLLMLLLFKTRCAIDNKDREKRHEILHIKHFYGA